MEFDPEAFEASVVAKCAVDHTRVYACVFHEGYCVATTSDGRVVVWNVHRHLVRFFSCSFFFFVPCQLPAGCPCHPTSVPAHTVSTALQGCGAVVL
jgi:hypothetical protein